MGQLSRHTSTKQEEVRSCCVAWEIKSCPRRGHERGHPVRYAFYHPQNQDSSE